MGKWEKGKWLKWEKHKWESIFVNEAVFPQGNSACGSFSTLSALTQGFSERLSCILGYLPLSSQFLDHFLLNCAGTWTHHFSSVLSAASPGYYGSPRGEKHRGEYPHWGKWNCACLRKENETEREFGHQLFKAWSLSRCHNLAARDWTVYGSPRTGPWEDSGVPPPAVSIQKELE